MVGAQFSLAAGQSAYIPSADLLVRVQEFGNGRATIDVIKDGLDLGDLSLESSAQLTAPLGGHAIQLVGTPESGAILRVQASAQIVDANTGFAFDLLREMRKQDSDVNVFLSPLSISMALTMTYNGADGATKTAMEDVLHLAGLDLDAINAGNAALLSALAGRQPELVLNIANSLWARDGVAFEPDFFARVEDGFEAEVESLPFDDAALARINGWVSDATEGKIEQILDRVAPDEVLYLINAIYFKASWESKFDEELTKEATFHNGDGTEARVPMMHRFDGKSGYMDGDGFVAVRLPYANHASMYVFLPDEDSSLAAFMDGLTAGSWATWVQGLRGQVDGNVSIPRFELEYEKKLNDVLIAMGMGVAFGAGADLSRMSPRDLNISFVKHKAVLEVHESGTEATAATIVGAQVTSAMPFRFDFKADRPFFFAITDDHTGSILFTGAVHELGL